MLTKEEAKEGVKKIVDDFLSIPKHEIDKKPEEQIKFQFIEPLFEALGWSKKDIEKEERVLKGRADYLLRIGNQEVLIIEAKKTNVMLTEDEGRQAVSYAYHRKIKFAVLTNFKEIRVYHALSNIKNIDKNLLQIEGNYFRLDVNEFLDKFDWLWLLSRESFENKEINKLLSAKDEKLAKPIDESILADLLKIREWLSKDIKAKKNYLEKGQIDEIVQLLVDRLIFIRSVEDRGLEPKNILLGWDSDVRTQRVKYQLFPYLIEKFAEFNDKYDSRLFESNILEKEGAFSDDVLHKVIRALYFGSEDNQDRYLFDQIPGDLLGSIYEQYLGTILSETEKRVKLDSETGKRKKMGIFYTPSYIVDYIVKNTVAEYIKDKSIDEILEVKIVDPACGSGSFITRAFQEVCDSIEERLKKGETSNNSAFKSYHEKLSLVQKITILTRCIHGVDLDEKAIELARLNLLLKLLEGEGQETKKLLLPHLENNIRCGNSLIDDPKISDRAFNWHAQFPDVFKNGGFDVVIGNPPYIRIQTLDKKDSEYIKMNYLSASSGNYDIYVIFIERSLHLLNKRGELGFILPNKFFNAKYGESIRKIISEGRYLRKIVDFGSQQIFEGAITYTCLLFLSKGGCENLNLIKINDLREWALSKEQLVEIINNNKITPSPWNLNRGEEQSILEKLEAIPTKLKDITSRIFQGLVTGADKVFLLKKSNDKFFSEATQKDYVLEKEILHPLCKGAVDIRRYYTPPLKKVILFPYKLVNEKAELLSPKEFNEKYPRTWEYLKINKEILESREGGKWKHEKWYAFGRSQNLSEMEQVKILTPSIASKASYFLDTEGKSYFVGSGGGGGGGYGITIKPKQEISYKSLLGLLNSKLLDFYLQSISSKFSGGYFAYNRQYIELLPIKFPDPTQEKKITELVTQMLELQRKYHSENISGSEKERLEQQIKNTDYEIDEEVYKLYGITEEEKKIIEESLK